MEDATPSKEDLVRALVFSVGLLDQSGSKLNPQAVELLKKVIFARYLDCIEAGYIEEANFVVREIEPPVPAAALAGT